MTTQSLLPPLSLYGRKTYEMLYPYWSSLTNNEMGVADKLNKGPKYVVSSTLRKAERENSSIVSQEVAASIRDIKSQQDGPILVQGSGTLVRQLLESNLVDELRLVIQPHLAEKGMKFFDSVVSKPLQLKAVKQLEKRVLYVSYAASQIN